MDTRRVGKSIASHDSLVGLHRHVHQTGYHTACWIDFLRIDVRLDVDVLVTLDDHRNFFQRRVARTLADTVNGHFHLTGAVQYTCHRISRRHTQIVMAVGGDNGVVNTVHMLHQVFYLGAILRRQAVTCRVGDVHHRRSRLDDGLDDTGQVFILRTSGVFGIELHIVHKAAGILHGSHGALDDFLTIGVEFIADVRIRSTDTRVDTFVFGIFQGFSRYVDIFLYGTCQGTDGRPCHCFGYFNHRIEVARA